MKNLLLIAAILFVFISCNKQQDNVSTKDDIVIISTEFGEMHIALYDETPKHKENFLKLAKEGFYDSTTFHRIIEGFMIQGGDPNSKDDNEMNDGQGSLGYTIEAEFSNKFSHRKGALSAARLGDQQNPEKRSSGSQFYIVHGRPVQSLELDQMQEQKNESARQIMIREYIQAPEQVALLEKLNDFMKQQLVDSMKSNIDKIEPIATKGFIPTVYTDEQRAQYADLGGAPFLDGNYTVFGEVIKGLEIIDEIVIQPANEMDRPLEDITMVVRVETMERADIETQYGYSYQ